MPTEILYTARATAVGGRSGHARSDDGRLDVALARPPEMGGTAGTPGTNPEQMFAAGYAACFTGAMGVAAKESGKTVPEDTRVTGVVGFGPNEGGGFGLAVELQVEMPGVARADAEAIVHRAHELCPYSNATRGNIDVKLTVV